MKSGMSKRCKAGFAVFAFGFSFLSIFLDGGCAIVDIVTTPTRHEKEIPAEFDLGLYRDEKILVLVEQSGGLGADVNLRYHVTKAISRNLEQKVEIPGGNLVSYRKLSKFRSGKGDFSLLSPAEVGQALGAKVVLLVTVNIYELNKIPDMSYLSGFLGARAILLDTTTGARLWPESGESKNLKVGFEAEGRGKNVAVTRLVSTLAHCTTRGLYDCPMNKYEIADDRSGIGWESWRK
ncbi:MAG: hypothetical protein ACYS71_03295 [Planctomycetota bacterium]